MNHRLALGLVGTSIWSAVPLALLWRLRPLRTHLAIGRDPLTGPLADYVAAKEEWDQWFKRSEDSVLTCNYAELIMTSQTWRGYRGNTSSLSSNRQVDPAAKHAILMIAGGNWSEKLADPATPLKLPGEAQLFALLAETAKLPVAILLHVPQQPIFDGNAKIRSLPTRSRIPQERGQTWPLLAPMTKSAVRAMDATQEAMKKEWGLDIATFTVTGASKRGWTTWLTGAVDDRATAIAPMVIDMLNMSPHTKLQKESFGGRQSEQIDDYRGLDDFIDSPRGHVLRQIVDPWEYRDRLTQPKLVILGTNDRYWPLDACNLYWNDLKGEKYLIYVPNNGHGLNDRARLVAGLNALNKSVLTDKPLPKLQWNYAENGDGVELTVKSDVRPSRARLEREGSDADSRDPE